ncbi:expressed unknown protein [Seminavis robusta]|uniref:Uncharacterized protein n=1 Tax=Seminavis robusta TaxID=568900 RepID=A0A9N8EEY0_9STRA|nr:expressed unknown protein [Seminavis robusta]|eukprot:Sro994_g229030.1 n/a (142) ;mRNA; r:15427-15852
MTDVNTGRTGINPYRSADVEHGAKSLAMVFGVALVPFIMAFAFYNLTEIWIFQVLFGILAVAVAVYTLYCLTLAITAVSHDIKRRKESLLARWGDLEDIGPKLGAALFVMIFVPLLFIFEVPCFFIYYFFQPLIQSKQKSR